MSALAKPYAERDGSEIIEYDGFAVEYRDSSHRYWLHKDGERVSAISVTSALRVLEKPALVAWAERLGVEGAVRLIREGRIAADVELAACPGIVRSYGLGADAKRDAGADRGTAIHEALRVYSEDETVPNIADFSAEVRGYVQAACAWLLAAAPTPLQVETIIGSPEHLYAGRTDLIAEVKGRTVLCDFKTSPKARVFDEAHLQTAAYLGALPTCGINDVDGAVIVALGEDGEFTEAPCSAELEDFLAVLACHRAVGRVRSAAKAVA